MMKSGKLLLNADMGESFGAWTMGLDEQVMPFVDLANIACGFHASDPDVMRRTVALAARHGVMVGAHPSYPDLVGFGRRSMACSPLEIENFVLYQVGALAAMCRAEDTRMGYIKPHGALYNDMIRDPAKMRAVMKAVVAFDAALPLMVMATLERSALDVMAAEEGVTLWFEAFADRAYDGTGQLVPRSAAGAVHHDPKVIVEQAHRLAGGEPLRTIDGHEIIITADSLCVHGDNPESVAAVKAIRQALEASGTPE